MNNYEVIEYLEPRIKDYRTVREDNSDFEYDKKVAKDYEALEYIRSLVIRNTPVKISRNPYGIGFCPVCRGSVFQDREYTKYCFRCGQALLW